MLQREVLRDMGADVDYDLPRRLTRILMRSGAWRAFSSSKFDIRSYVLIVDLRSENHVSTWIKIQNNDMRLAPLQRFNNPSSGKKARKRIPLYPITALCQRVQLPASLIRVFTETHPWWLSTTDFYLRSSRCITRKFFERFSKTRALDPLHNEGCCCCSRYARLSN